MTMKGYENLHPYFGDLHNHCGISYGHGTLEEAFLNAKERLDFASVTGHAFWPDMPAPNEHNQQMIEFHLKGFKRLQEQWEFVQDMTESFNEEGKFVTFLGFEMHSSRFGDQTVVYRKGRGDILYSQDLPNLREKLRELRGKGIEALMFPHHIGYRQGHRGINWDAFTPEFSSVVEMISMHGCCEADENPRPYLHTMGPLDHEGTIQFGLGKGHILGVIGSTDHHSAHPGSYGHGLTGLWAEDKSRSAIWDALIRRRTYALTGDRIALKFAVNGNPMGSVLAPCKERRLEIHVEAGGAIDYLDVVWNNRLLRRFSENEVKIVPAGKEIRTKLWIELGWGPRQKRQEWKVILGISHGRILGVEPRFRGREVVSPLDETSGVNEKYHTSQCRWLDERKISLRTETYGNPNNFTSGTQGVCLDVLMPLEARLWADFNGKYVEVLLETLLKGSQGEPIDEMPAPSYRFHRAVLPWEFDWSFSFDHCVQENEEGFYYARVRQKNDQWAWSSPIFMKS